jgi:TetR/AcrR family transcriptional repressor of nem operon
MPRPPEFERSHALDAALKLFWCQGYTATSLSQLLDAMGIGRGSFYAAFGDKRTLFIECLELFSRRTRDILLDAWERNRSPAAISEFFDQTLFQVPSYRAQRGCLMVNTILELADVDPALSQLADRRLGEIEQSFAHCFGEAQASGQYPTDRTPEELAACVMVINQGLRVASRKRVPRRELRHTADNVLNLLGLAAV